MSKENACPWCGIEQTDLWDYYSLQRDEDNIDTECQSCSKKLKITLNISYDYKIKAIGCKMHKLDLVDYWWPESDFLMLKCIECKNDFYDWDLPNGKYPKMKDGEFEFVGAAIKAATDRGLLKLEGVGL